jgi:hypothetical protein
MRYTTDVRWWLEYLSTCNVYKSVDQNIPNNLVTQITFDSVAFDNLGEWDTVNSRFVAQNAGYYSIGGVFTHRMGANAGQVRLMVLRNAANTFYMFEYGNANLDITIAFERSIQMAAGDTIHVEILQATGVATTILGTGAYTTFHIDRIAAIL